MSNRRDNSGRRLLTRGSWSEAKRFTEILREETVGGVLLLAAAGVPPAMTGFVHRERS